MLWDHKNSSKEKKTPFDIEADLLAGWRKHPVTKTVYHKLYARCNPMAALRNCPADKIEYYRGQADLLDMLRQVALFEDEE